jgi:hypothetical protein
MAIQQGTLERRQAARFGAHLGGFVAATVFRMAVKMPLRLACRAVFGQSHGPRGYKREKFPEAQWQQILAGKRNWFD